MDLLATPRRVFLSRFASDLFESPQGRLDHSGPAHSQTLDTTVRDLASTETMSSTRSVKMSRKLKRLVARVACVASVCSGQLKHGMALAWCGYESIFSV